MPTPDEPEPEPSEPDSDHADEEPRETPNYSDLIHVLEDEGGLDDATPERFDAGVVIVETEGEAGPDDIPSNVDFGTALRDEPSLGDASDDASGPAGEDPGLFVTGGETEVGDDADGIDDSIGGLLPDQLPPLDGAAPSDDDPGEEHAALETTFDEGTPPAADRPWVAVPISKAVGSRSLVVAIGAKILAAERDILEIRDDGSTRIVAPRVTSTVTGIASCPGSDALLFTTKSGLVFRADLASPSTSPAMAWRDAGAVSSTSPFSVAIGGPTPSSRPALLLHVSGVGALLETTDHGVTFRRVDVRDDVRALATGTPPFCIVASGTSMRVVRSLPSGGFANVDADLRAVANLLGACADGDTLVLHDAVRGVFVSADSGSTFTRSSHTASATAVTAGRVGGHPTVFAALLGPDGSRTTLVCIDARSAEAKSIAEITEPPDDEGESARVVSLAWDENTGTLWAAGSFGLKRFRSPPSA